MIACTDRSRRPGEIRDQEHAAIPDHFRVFKSLSSAMYSALTPALFLTDAAYLTCPW